MEALRFDSFGILNKKNTKQTHQSWKKCCIIFQTSVDSYEKKTVINKPRMSVRHVVIKKQLSIFFPRSDFSRSVETFRVNRIEKARDVDLQIFFINNPTHLSKDTTNPQFQCISPPISHIVIIIIIVIVVIMDLPCLYIQISVSCGFLWQWRAESYEREYVTVSTI